MIQGPHLIDVTNPDDPAIAEFRAIRERDLVRTKGQFIAEGSVVLRLLAAAHNAGTPFQADKILVLKNKLDGIADILALFPQDIPVYIADSNVLDKIAGFHLHRGILALGHKLADPALSDCLAALPQKSLITLCAGISNHDNAGAIFRNSAAFGSDLVLLDETSCDPLYRKAIRVSVGSVLTQPWIKGGNINDILENVQNAGYAVWALSPNGQTDIQDIPPTDKIALLLGTEGEGLPAPLLNRLSTAKIAQRSTLDSLNVATAAAIALHQVAAQSGRL